MLKVEMGHISDNNLGRNHDNDNLLAGGTVVSPTPYTPNLNSALLRSSNSQTFAENYPSLSSTTTSSTPTEKCVICDGTPAFTDSPNIYPTCGKECSSKLLAACGHDLPNTDESRTPTPPKPNMSSTPDIFDKDRESPKQSSEPTRTDKQIEMCMVCNDAPVYRDSSNVHTTCGMACASKLLAAYDQPQTNEPRTSDPPNTSSSTLNVSEKSFESPRRSSALARTYADSRSMEVSVVSNNNPIPYMGGPNIYPTYAYELATSGLPNNNRPLTLDLPNMTSAPNVFDNSSESPKQSSALTRTLADRSMKVSVVFNDPPLYKGGSTRTHPTSEIATSGLPNIDRLLLNKPLTSDLANMTSAPDFFDNSSESPKQSSALTRTFADRSMTVSVVSNGPPVYKGGSDTHPTYGIATSGLPNTNRLLTNKPLTSDPPNTSSVPNDKGWESPRQSSELKRTSIDGSMEMCVISNDAAAYRGDSPNIYPTNGIATSRLPNTNRLLSNKSFTSDLPNMSSAPKILDKNWDPPRWTSELTRTYTNKSTEMCVICHVAPAHRDGLKIYSTCGMICAYKLQAASGLPNSNKPRTLDQRNSASMSSAPRNNDYITRSSSLSRPSQTRIGMCDVCHVRPRCQRGGTVYPTCGLSCADKLKTSQARSAGMCDYCGVRPKVVVDGKVYPQCGNTCRDKAKFAKTACIVCRESTKAGESDFCSKCHSLAEMKAPILIEIPRGHVAYEKVAEVFTSQWQTSKTPRPTVKGVYMVMVETSSKRSFEKYLTKIESQVGRWQRRRTQGFRWLVFSRECGFGDRGNLEPCCSYKCLLCSIVTSSFHLSDFPEGIKTSTLNRATELSRSGKRSSSKIAVLTRVVVGREAEMSPEDMKVVRPLPPRNADSVHIIGERYDGTRVDKGDIIVYDGDAVYPIYLISYE